jgi:hypothetical protein
MLAARSPDNATLVLAESHGKRLTAFDISSDGSLSHRRVWANLGDGVPDGICLDAEGGRVVCRRSQQALCARARRGRVGADDFVRPRMLRLYARWRRSEDVVSGDTGVARHGEGSR